VWKNLRSTSDPSTRHALVVPSPDVVFTDRVIDAVRDFYANHPEIGPSHGLEHVMRVYRHAVKAVECHRPPLPSAAVMEIKVAALLHDVDDAKYFPQSSGVYENALLLMRQAEVPEESQGSIVEMISLVSCSKNGNRVPASIEESGEYHRLIPRWADRLEAVGAAGAVRCYQYSKERGRPLSSPRSPRAQTIEQVWEAADPDRFDSYQSRGGLSDDMISHFYDKLLHVARPPPAAVRNEYLERKASESAEELLEICTRFGKTGLVDEDYIRRLAEDLNI
jgi:uncharacterized protein